MRSRFFIVGVLIFILVFAGAVVWVGSNVNYYINEDVIYYHNLSANITGFNSEITFAIDTQSDINWSNGASNLVTEDDVAGWLFISNSTTGNLTINAIFDNQTGFFIVPIQANNASGDDTITSFEFQINATNDIPVFLNLNSSYDFSYGGGDSYTINAADEESHYPLGFNLTFINNCTHASWSGRNVGENCSIFNLSGATSTSVNFDFDNSGFNDVGTYWANFSVHDFNGACPHQYCDAASYNGNKSSAVYLLKFNVYSSLSIDASNCSGASIVEGSNFNCTINITTREEADSLDFSSLANLVGRAYIGNKSWFFANMTNNATDFFYSLPVSVTPGKSQVGNWTINVSVGDGSTLEVERIGIFVNISEANVSLATISPVSLYENGVIYANASDEDLLVQDYGIKREILTFSTNDSSRVSVVAPVEDHTKNYAVASLNINHTKFLESGEGNYSINVSVVDTAGNRDWKIFVVEILNESAPEWNVSLGSPVVLNLTEGIAFSYNVSKNVTDDENDPISFYYENVSAEFCSLNSSNFNSSSGIINFTPTDCGVGYYEVNIIASDSKLNSSWSFVFNVSNVADVPVVFSFTGNNGTQSSLIEGFNFIVAEGTLANFSLIVDDDDFLIPVGQRSLYYNESLNINVTFTNSTGGRVNLFNFSFVEFGNPSAKSAAYSANFLPSVGNVGNYIVFVNISDVAGNSINRTWNLNVTENLDPPILFSVSNVSLTIHDILNFSVNGSDDEDDYYGLNLSYFILALDAGAPNLTVTGKNVLFNMSSNQSLSGKWRYNISVVDNDSMADWQEWNLSIYGFSNLFLPAANSSFNLIENVSSILNFTINHSVRDDLVYQFWIDNMSCWLENGTTLNCSYGNLSLRETQVGVGNGSVLRWSFLPNFLDESYGLKKNLTVRVYPNASGLSLNQSRSVASNFSFKLNITHSNAPMRNVADIGLLQADYNTNIALSLEGYFEDEDVDDPYYSQDVTFTKASGDGDVFVTHSGGWNIQIGTTLKSVHEASIFILGDDNSTSDTTERIQLSFTQPQTTTSSGGGSSTKLKFYSLRIIVPEDVIISDEDYIEIPFGLENTGAIDLHGIDLSSSVLYNNQFADDVKIDLGVSYVESLMAGERKDYTMKILADTDRSGKYKATIFANITSPKFMDWGDFFIDLRRTNESEAEELLVFTEKLIADNPECLELTEVFRRAREAFEAGDEIEAIRLAEEVSAACEDAIIANEQIKYRIEGFVERNFYYISFVTLVMFFVGFIVYVYKRIRFNKSEEDMYIR